MPITKKYVASAVVAQDETSWIARQAETLEWVLVRDRVVAPQTRNLRDTPGGAFPRGQQHSNALLRVRKSIKDSNGCRG